ncbi:MAG: 16S rRNA (cytosine(967)-C(5))-methyltransferase RsmB [Eubacterium sp.]|nr:16S rRNA (cytosine(967)-C(5))-methyltransferase RsmB [Eubacterium sp.]
MTADSRDIVYRILVEKEESGSYVGDILEVQLRKNQFQDKQIRAFITRLTEGVVEREITLDFLIKKFSKTPFNKIKTEIKVILRMGIYQILYMDSVPDRAAVSEAVKLAEAHKLKGLTGYVNAVLRAVVKAREDNRINGMLCSSREVRFSTPKWLVDFLVKTYGKETADKILSAQFENRPTSIRVNTTKISTEKLRESFEEQKIRTEEGRLSKQALLIDDYDFIRKLPGFGKGFFSVQDESSMYAVERLLEASKAGALEDSEVGRNTEIAEGTETVDVLELCAAPGGKSLYMAELLGERGRVTARDLTVAKTDLIRENAERLGLENVEVQERDAVCLDGDMIGRADIVIADVPCSGLGVMGHKNDIKYNVSEDGMKELSKLGKTILRNAVMYVKDGGVLMFSTCTINPGENGDVVHSYLEENGTSDGFKLIEERTFLQGIDPCDGFYFAILKKA